MFLLEGKKAPSKSTLAQFRSETPTDVIEDLFFQIVEQLRELGEIGGKTLYVDGTKLEANANRYSFVWRKAVEKNQAKLAEKLLGILPEVRKEYGLNPIDSAIADLTEVQALLVSLEDVRKEQEITFVYGTGRRKTKLQKDIEFLQNCVTRMEQYVEYGGVFQGRNSFSKTDHDATFMRMKDDYMRNGQLKPAYNIQIGVDAEYIVGVDISSERDDVNTLIPLLERMEQLSFQFETVVADAGYESEENYRYLEDLHIKANIKPQNYEKSKGRAYKTDISRAENMAYNEELDYYLCAQGRQIVPIQEQKKKSGSGYINKVTIYECEGCEGCPDKVTCIKSKSKLDLALRNKRLYISKDFQCYRAAALERITTSEGILLRLNRSIQVEGVFGAIKEDMAFRRFLTRGKEKVRAEFLFLAMGHNLLKMHNKIQGRRIGQHLHRVEVA